VRKEILKGNVLINISKLSADGLLHTMLPEIEVMRNYEQRKDKHPEGNVFNHTCRCLSILQATDSDIIKACVLLHDIGKLLAFNDGHYRGHDKMGVDLAIEVARKLEFSEAEIALIAWCVKEHMKPHVFNEMKTKKKRKLCEHHGLGFLMIVHHADCYTSPRPCNNNTIIEWMLAHNISNDSIDVYISWRNSRCIL
jgi:hypothetical protein